MGRQSHQHSLFHVERVLFLLAAALLFAIPSGAQPATVPITGNLTEISGSPGAYTGILIDLVNCPSPASITGYYGIVQASYQLQAASDGSVNGSVWPNNLVDCNGTTGNSQYQLTYLSNGSPAGTPQCYQVTSGNIWNLSTQQPVTCSQSPPSPQDATFNNVVVNGVLTLSGGIAAVPITAGGTGASTAPAALTSLGAFPAAGGTMTGPLKVPYINTIPQADQSAGADICVKIRAAATYAIANNINQVDASHFSGAQACSVDMLGGIAAPSAASVNLVVNLGAVHIQSSVAQTITNSGITLHGMGPMQTQIEYVGISSVPAILTVEDIADGLGNASVGGIYLYGDSSNATDGLLIEAVHHSEFRNVWTWGVTGCGIHSKFAVTDTWYRPRTSKWDAIALGIFGAGHSVPTSGLCMDALSGSQTTDGTVIDAAAEFVSGIGWHLISAQGMTFMAGTSESNAHGLQIDNGSLGNTFINGDFESNTSGNDVLDNGYSDVFQNIDAFSGPTNALEIGATGTTAYILNGHIQSTQFDAGSSYTSCIGGVCTFPGNVSTAAQVKANAGFVGPSVASATVGLELDSKGTSPVTVNFASGSGTGGFTVCNGSGICNFSVNAGGTASANALDQDAAQKFAGTCLFSASTTCSVTYSAAYTLTPVVLIQPVGPGATTFTLTSSTSTGFTITASASNSVAVNWLAVGNPN